jgi:hypothetical protein
MLNKSLDFQPYPAANFGCLKITPLPLKPLAAHLLEQLPGEMVHVLLNFLCEMLQELVHILTFMLHDVFGDIGCVIMGLFECMIIQTADLLGLFL